jgi:hypothetical protein
MLSKAATVDDYLAELSPDRREEIEAIRTAIRSSRCHSRASVHGRIISACI